jgi:phosphoribosyl 1,2-cyclic phosphate phosphodiesterase
LKVTFLGTGTSQGVPVIACTCPVCLSENSLDQRLRSSVLIEHLGCKLVIDSGPDFRQQMLRAKVNTLDAILFTHEHKDHIAGLDDIRAYNYIQKRPMDIYAEQRVLNELKREFPYVFAEKKYPGVPEMFLHEIENHTFNIGTISVNPIRVMHMKLPIFGYRIDDFAYITDANKICPEEKEKLLNLKVLVVNALRIQKHISHFNLAEALELIEELKPERAYLTHISHMLGFHTDISKGLPNHVLPAFDGLQIEV